MKKFNMGHGAGSGTHGTSVLRVYGWLWHAWLEALKEVAGLRWLALAAVLCALGLMSLAVAEGKSALEICAYGGTAFGFVAALAAIQYSLFEIYRHHRSEAIFDSKRLADHIRAIVKEELEAGDPVLMRFDRAAKEGENVRPRR